MGYLFDDFRISLVGKTPDGTCPECGVKHRPEYPHNRDSLAYQYQFYDKHGRFPTWSDAMSHCSDEMKKIWVEELQKRGVEV